MDKLDTLVSLADGLGRRGDKPAVMAFHKEGYRQWSYAELGAIVEKLAHGLVGIGVRAGDHVALYAESRAELIFACLAVLKAGAVVTPVDAQFKSDVLRGVLNDSESRFVFTTERRVSQIESLDVEPKPRLLLIDAESDHELSWRRLLGHRIGELPRVEPGDPAMLFYTSGTTGPPKGVPLSHRNIAFQLNRIIESNLVVEDDRALLPLPLHHVYPLAVGTLVPLAAGLTLVLPQSVVGPQIVRALREGRVTVIVGVPRLFSALYSGIQGRAQAYGRAAATLFETVLNMSAWVQEHSGVRPGKFIMRPVHTRFSPYLRLLTSGGAALDPGLARKLEALGWQIAIGYGLTETSPLLTLNPPGSGRLASVGRPIEGVEIRIDTSKGKGEPEEREVSMDGAVKETGEILARGPNVFSGYRNLPDKTRESFTEDGWFRTGDMGYFDADGFLYIKGRASTMIVTEGGENIQPGNVEGAYAANPLIREVGILQKDGRLVGLIVPELNEIRKRGEEDIERALREAVNEVSRRLPTYQRISDYAITGEPLDRTRLGKIRRHLLLDRYDRARGGMEAPAGEAARPISREKMSESDRALLENPAADQVWEWLTGRYSDRRLTLDTSPQLDLGVDSMEWLNITMEIGRRASVELSDEAIAQIEIVRDLLHEVAAQSELGEASPGPLPLEDPENVLNERQKRWLEPLGPVMSSTSWLLYALNRTIMRLVFRVEVEGLEHIEGLDQFVLTPNHTSYLDPFAIAAVLPFQLLRRTYWSGWVGAAFGNPVNRMVSRLARTVPIDPGRAVISSIAFGAAVLKRGRNLIWFPEGRRSPSGRLQPFRSGVGMLLSRYRVAAVPAFIQGSYEAMPPGRAIPRSKPIRIVFGRPLGIEELESEDKDEGKNVHERVAEALHRRVDELGRSAGRQISSGQG